MNELMQRYEESIERLYKADEWLESKGYNSWEDVRRTHPNNYKARKDIIKELEQMQRDIHLHLATN